MDLPSDLIDLLAEFDATKVDYVLVGGLAWSSRVLISCAGVPTSVVGREELIHLKRASGRPQDLLDAVQLEGLDRRS